MKKEKSRLDNRRKLTGVITSNSMEGTVKVLVVTPTRHPVYRKVVTRRKTFMASTDQQLEIGDNVVIRETKPKSKNVRWEVITEDK